MEYQIITVVYTKRVLRPTELEGQKRYRFICSKPVKIGDLIESPVYATPCQVVDVRHYDHIPTYNGRYLKEITVDRINGKIVNKNFNNNNEVEMKQEQNHSDNMFDQLTDSFVAQYMPTREPEVRMSMNGLLCVPQGDKYVGIDANNKLISFLPAMTISGFPVFSIEKPVSMIVPGDIIKRNRSYAKVLENTAEGLRVLSFSGVATKQAAITDMLLGQATFRVLVNFFSPSAGMGNINPMAFMLMGNQGEDKDGFMKMMVMGQMFQGGGGMFGNMFQQPAGQPAAQQPVAPGMFPGFMQPAVQQPVVQQTPVQQPVAPQPAAPQPMNTAEIIEALLKNPETRNQLKEALKD